MSGVSRVSGSNPVFETGAAAPASEAQASSAPALCVGVRGPAVKALQEKLIAAGVKVAGGADGIFGRGTQTAVAQFQKSHGLPATGAADAATLAALDKAGARKVEGFKLGGKPNGTGAGHGPKPLVARIGGKDVKLADDALMAKIAGNGRYLAWTNPKGSGGYENEGQGLMVFDARTGKTAQVMSEYYMADDIVPTELPDGRTALLVPLSDGGLGLKRLAFVDPTRGVTAYIEGAEIVGKPANGKVTIRTLKVVDGDITAGAKKTLDLKKLLDQPVIKNEYQGPGIG
jgi:peptidoglycan hydrolase-like protein with peptidoglycan-binding domain